MHKRPVVALLSLLLVIAACGDEPVTETTVPLTVATTTTTTTTTLIPTTTSSTAPTTTATATTQPPEETTTSAPAETTTTTRVPLTTTTTEAPPAEADPDLVPYAGLFRQPTVWNGYLEFDPTGVLRAGTDPADLAIEGRWDYDDEDDEYTFWDLDFGDGCDGAEGRYSRDIALGGGQRISLVEDPCQARVDFITQPGSSCQCFLYLEVEFVD